MINLVHFRP